MDRGKAMAMDTQEFRLAILHTVVAESKPGTGKTHLQKLCYFLQNIFDVPTKYSFRMHHYGPYAEALETDMARLRITGYIDIKPDSQGVVEITSIDDSLEEWGPFIEHYKPQVAKAIEAFGNRPTSELELAATIHFVTSLLPDESSDVVLSKVKALKPKCKEDDLHSLHAELETFELGSNGHVGSK